LVASGPGPAAGTVSHLEAVKADLVARQYPAGVSAANPAGPPPHASS
jgi:hypothetical protein